VGDTTTEKLRLEIEVAAQDALKYLTSTASEIKRLAAEAQASVPPVNQLKVTIAQLQSDLKTSATTAEFFGDEVGGLRDRQALLKNTIVDLIKSGIAPETQELQELKSQYDETSEKLKHFDDSTVSLTDKIGKLAATGAALAAANKIKQFSEAAVADFANAEASSERLNLALQMRGMAAAAPALNALAERLKKVAGIDDDLTTQIEAELIAQGKSEIETEKIIRAAAGMSAVSGDLSSNVQKLESSYSGVAGGIGRAIPEFKNLTDEQLRAGAGVDLMLAKYEGFTGKTGKTTIALAIMKASIDDAKKAFGEGLSPIVIEGSNAISAFASILEKIPTPLKEIGGIITTVLLVALGALVLRTVAVTAAEWGLFGAKMAVNAATAVGNPLLWAGIAAAVAAVAATTALVAAKVKEAKAMTDASNQYDANAAAMDAAKQSADAYRDSVEKMSKAELESAAASLRAAMLRSTNMGGLTEAANQLKIIDERLAKLKQADLDAKAATFKASWSQTYGQSIADQSSNPYASINYEEQQKLAEVAASNLTKTDKKTIDEISAYYYAKRKVLADSIAKDEASQLAKLTATKVDDLQLEEKDQINALNALEIKAVAAEGLTQNQISAIHAKYASLRASVDIKYSQEISDTRKQEVIDAAAAYFDLSNKERAAAVALTVSKVDDLELERDRALALFKGTEVEKLALSSSYAKKIADAQIEEDKRVFAERLANAKSSGDYGTYAALSTSSAISSTQVGQMLGAGGAAAADPMIVLVDAAVKFATSLESVQKVLNVFDTGLSGMKTLVDGLLGGGADELVNTIVDIGEALGNVAAPFLGLFVLNLKITTALLNTFVVPRLQLLGKAFAWLYDSVIVPVGNAFISIVNGVIQAINSALGWAGVSISYVAALKTTAQIAAEADEIAAKVDAVSDTMSDVQAIFDDKKNDLKEAYDKNISALKNLLELGAISATDYASRISTLNSDYTAAVKVLETQEKAQLKTLQEILDSLNKGNDISTAALHAAGVAGYAVGAIEIPETQSAIVHKGETIIPASFAAGIRSGELSLSKLSPSSSSSGSSLSVEVYVAGSVTTENDLADKVGTNIARRIKRGQLETAS
jgi:hypothetical protein